MSQDVTVTCKTAGCENENIEITFPDHEGSYIECGVCNARLADEYPWYVPPEEPDFVDSVVEQISALSPEDFARLVQALQEK